MTNDEASIVPVTKLRIRIPKGMPVTEAIRRLEISFEEVEPADVEGQQKIGDSIWGCCVDAAIATSVYVVSHH